MYIDELFISNFVKGIYNNWLNRKYEELEERAKKDEFSSFFEFEREFERLRQDYEVIEYHHLKVKSSIDPTLNIIERKSRGARQGYLLERILRESPCKSSSHNHEETRAAVPECESKDDCSFGTDRNAIVEQSERS